MGKKKESKENGIGLFKKLKLDIGNDVVLPSGSINKKVNLNDKYDNLYFSDEETLEKIEHNTPVNLETTSDERYFKIVEDIVKTAKAQLKGQNEAKTQLRKIFVIFFVVLLSVQMLAVITFMTLTAIKCVEFAISDALMTTFIVSVFVETLGAIIIMITFAFASKEEVTVVELLIQVVKNYQKYKRNDGKQEYAENLERNIHI